MVPIRYELGDEMKAAYNPACTDERLNATYLYTQARRVQNGLERP
jgi:hypothetical protein